MLTVLRSRSLLFLASVALGLWWSPSAQALQNSVPAVDGNVSRTQLGNGTGVRIAILDSGVDVLHPALTGNDSQGNPRLVAQSNFASDAGTDDLHGHGTHVAGISLSSDATNQGMAPDARFINARTLDATNSFASTNQVINAGGYAVSQGANIMNMSLNTFAIGGYNNLERFVDWSAYNRGTISAVCAGNISQAQGGANGVRSPGFSFNALSVARTNANYNRIDNDASNGPLADGRSKPDISAPGTNIMSAAHNWEGANPDFVSLSGCSMATPHVSGMLAQQWEYGAAQNANWINPLTLKATIMNSAVTVLDKGGNAWAPGASAVNGGVLQITQPLDTDSGAGQIDGTFLTTQYRAGQHGPGLVPITGWDLDTITGTGDLSKLTYTFNAPLGVGTEVDATLTWFRHVTRTDQAPLGTIDANDTFAVGDAGVHLNLDNLNLALVLLGGGGGKVVESISTVDNVEHFKFTIAQAGNYALEVTRLAVNDTGVNELYGLAWYVPEPSVLSLLILGIPVMMQRRRGRNI